MCTRRSWRDDLADYAKYTTDFIHDITWDDIRMTKDCFGSFSGDIETYAPIHFEGATLCVGGDLLQHHTVSMHDHNDFLLVEGNWELEPRMADDAEHLLASVVGGESLLRHDVHDEAPDSGHRRREVHDLRELRVYLHARKPALEHDLRVASGA